MAKGQFHINQEIETFIRDQDEAGRAYTPDQITYINQYTGSGGMGSKGATGQGVLYEFYTPDYVCDLMWELARHYGFRDETGTVLEPSCATGRLIRPAKHYKNCVGFEINPTSARIAALTYPGLTVHSHYFETAFLRPPRFTERINKTGQYEKQAATWLTQAPFDLVIGNPPYGIYQNEYSGYFPETRRLGLKQIEIFFMAKGLDLLKIGGLLIYLTGSNFMRNGLNYQTAKDYMGSRCDLVDAYRLPPVFDTSKVPTDILVFRRK